MRMNHQIMNTIQRWITAARPKTLPASISPVLVGIAIALMLHKFHLLPSVVILCVAILIQISANLINDVIDFQHGTDTSARLGPLRVTQAGLLTPHQVWKGIIVVLGLAILSGIYLATIAGWPIIIIGLVCIIAAFAYSAGPTPLARYGLGDLFALVFFGLTAVCGTTYILTGQLPLSAWLGGLGAGVLVTNILVVNNVRDIESDRQAGRTNIPIYFGRQAGELEYTLMQAVAYLVPVVILVFHLASAWVLLPYLSLLGAIMLNHKFRITPTGRVLNEILARTAQLLLFYSLLLSLGFALSALA
jgi:1,4-dihydroxy-2-naphthoate octaprenyltransferase